MSVGPKKKREPDIWGNVQQAGRKKETSEEFSDHTDREEDLPEGHAIVLTGIPEWLLKFASSAPRHRLNPHEWISSTVRKSVNQCISRHFDHRP